MAVHKKYDRNVLGRGLDDIGNGRGLDALIDTGEVRTQGSSNLCEISLDLIEPNPNQPRREFDEDALRELAASIREIGIIQPITLRKAKGDKLQIIAGERRWRAAQMAGLTTIPAYIRTVEDENAMEMALIENIQREDLNAIEIALAYEHLAETSGMTQERIAERVGKSRAAVANYMRLLKLPAQVQMALKNHEVDMGHARALLALDSPSMQIKLFREIQKNGYSVRKVEEIVKAANEGGVPAAKAAAKPLPPAYEEAQGWLAGRLGTKVQLTCGAKGKGKISIAFDDEATLRRILDAIGANGQQPGETNTTQEG